MKKPLFKKLFTFLYIFLYIFTPLWGSEVFAATTITFLDDVEHSPVNKDTIKIKVTDYSNPNYLKFVYTTQSTCDSSRFGGGSSQYSYQNEVAFDIDSMSQNGRYICARAKKGSIFTYQRSTQRLNIDTIKPTGSISINSGAEYTNNNNAVFSIQAQDNVGVIEMNLSEVNTFSGVNWQNYATTKFWLFGSSQGRKTIYIKFRDAAGNESTTYSDSIILDTIPPQITINNPTVTPQKSKTYTASTNEGTLSMFVNNAGDTLCNNSLAFIPYSEVTFSSENDNGKSICYKAEDLAGNKAFGLSIPVQTIDLTLPVITLVGLTDITVEKGSTYIDQGAIAIDNVDGDITENIVVFNNVDTSTVGKYQITYDVTDTAGNIASTKIRTIEVEDTTPPTQPTFSADITEVTNSDVTIAITYSVDSVKKYFQIDSGATQEYISPVGMLLNGVIYAWAVDEYDNACNPIAFTVDNIDKEKPVISLLGNPVVTLTVGATYTDLGATATDNRDGNITKDILVNSNVNTLIVGTYLITYNITDTAGNDAVQVSRVVIIDPLPVVEREETTQAETTNETPEVLLAVVTTKEPTTTVTDTFTPTTEILDTDVLSEDTQDEDDTEEEDTEKEEVKGTEDDTEDSKPNRLPLYIVLGISFVVVLYLMFRKKRENSTY